TEHLYQYEIIVAPQKMSLRGSHRRFLLAYSFNTGLRPRDDCISNINSLIHILPCPFTDVVESVKLIAVAIHILKIPVGSLAVGISAENSGCQSLFGSIKTP